MVKPSCFFCQHVLGRVFDEKWWMAGRNTRPGMWPQHGPKTGYGKEMWPQMNGMYGKDGKANAYFLQLKEGKYIFLSSRNISLKIWSRRDVQFGREIRKTYGNEKRKDPLSRWNENEKGQVHKQKEQRKYHILYSYPQYLIFSWTWFFYRFKLLLFCYKRCIQASNRLDSLYSLQVTPLIKCGYSVTVCYLCNPW